MELKKHMTGEKMGISYTLCGDYYQPEIDVQYEETFSQRRG